MQHEIVLILDEWFSAMKIRRERVSGAPAQVCSPQRSSRADRDSPAVGVQRQRNFQLPGSRLLARAARRPVSAISIQRSGSVAHKVIRTLSDSFIANPEGGSEAQF
jgi:hypothetical protein